MFVTNNIYLVGYKWVYGMDVSRNWFGIIMWFVGIEMVSSIRLIMKATC